MRPVDAPPGERQALEIIAETYAEHGLPGDIDLIAVTWWGGECLSRWKIDTDHWTLVRRCVKGVAAVYWLNVIRTDYIWQSALAHEVKHAFQFQHGAEWGDNVEHHADCWRSGMIQEANQRIYEAGL